MGTGIVTAAEFWDTYGDAIRAGFTLLLALLVVYAIKRAFSRRGRALAEAVMRGELSQEADTRLRFLRRLAYAVVITFFVAVALAQFTGFGEIAGSLLASGAIVAAIVGFAARTTLGNVIAGVMIALSQPVRVGDWVQFEDHYGVIEDVRLNFCVLKTGADQRVVIPNEKIASGIVRNDTLLSPQVGTEVELWIPASADAEAAVEVLEDESGGSVSVVEQVPWGIRLSIGGASVPPPERFGVETDLRRRCLRRLRESGLTGF